jgi:hypothetical protein
LGHRREGLAFLQLVRAIEFLDNDLCGLPGANEWAGENQVELDVHFAKRFAGRMSSFYSLRCESAIPVSSAVAALFGEP